MAELVATMVVGPLLSIVKEKASSYLLDQYKVMEGMEDQHKILKRKLPAILDIITDAEEQAAHREGAKAWLEELKMVAYDANQVFDEFKYEALRRQARANGHYTKLGFHVIKLFPTHNRVAFRNKMGNKLSRIVQVIEVLVAEMNAFGFHYKQQAPPSKQWRQTDHVIFDPQKIISKSRDEDCKSIVDILLGQACNTSLTVVPIVGMGGLGKTTLAQLVFNHHEIQKHFELLLWVCVSDHFDVNSLANTIVEAVPKKQDGYTETDDMKKKEDYKEADAMKKKEDYTEADVMKKGNVKADFKKSELDCLKDALTGQRYLLVLDDVWNREGDKWEKLKANLQYGGKGSAVLTTTRDEGVANVMSTTSGKSSTIVTRTSDEGVANVMDKVKPYNLRGLKDEFIEEIIKARAFSSQMEEERSGVLVEMVGEIVKRCCGSPLAATALGSILSTKNTKEEWQVVSSRSNICTVESGILPILKLSYNDLPSHMKQCFAFCAVFPKDYEIDVDTLIQLWIANGFIQEQEGVRLETIGKCIFNELASRSFFQHIKQARVLNKRTGRYTWRKRNTCKIHDLMHDVAQSIMEKECVAASGESSHVKWLTNTARHLFLSCSSPQLALNTSLGETSPSIQTLVCDSDMSGSLQHLRKYNSLRALQLCTGVQFPLKPKQLHHLRYLDLSGSDIKALPEDISILYNLQTLNLSDCCKLNRLPRQMKYMTALRHLYTDGCLELKSMPPGLSKLVSLQTLTCFVAGTGSGCSNITELHDLDIAGEIELCRLENVTEEDAKATNLIKKKEIRKLALKWSVGCEEDAKVLEGLEPHDEELQAIRIYSYGGTTFPKWMIILSKMTEIHLYRCDKVQYLFSCDTPFAFPNLKELTLVHLPKLERLCERISVGPGEEFIFPHLEKLFISSCGELTSLPGQPAFPNLLNACVMKCPLLKTQVEAPRLDLLDMEGGEEDMFLWVANHMTSLTDLKLEHAVAKHDESESSSTPSGCFGIISCKRASLAVPKPGVTVAELSVARHSLNQVMENRENTKFPLVNMMLTGLVLGVTELCSCFLQLQDLTIYESDALVHWPEKEFQNLVSLRTLEITRCNKLAGYAQVAPLEPSSERSNQLLPNLEFLKIFCCDSLVEVFNVPASLRKMEICVCRKVESIFGRKQQQQGMSEQHFLLPCLEYLEVQFCRSFTGVLDLPPSLKTLKINWCSGLRSLESRSGELSLQSLTLSHCRKLSSLPDGLQSYSSLEYLDMRKCHGIKTLPECLQQQLISIKSKKLDARYEVDLWKSKIWKYVTNA